LEVLQNSIERNEANTTDTNKVIYSLSKTSVIIIFC